VSIIIDPNEKPVNPSPQRDAEGYLINKRGERLPVEANVLRYLEFAAPFAIDCDERGRILGEGLPWDNPAQHYWSRSDDFYLTIYLQEQGLMVTEALVSSAVRAYADLNPFRPTEVESRKGMTDRG
jgi:hypothetical protein